MKDTHYLYRGTSLDPVAFGWFVADVRRIVDAVSPKLVVCGPEGQGRPEMIAERVALNGSRDLGQDHEPLVIDRVYAGHVRGGEGFTFCKTNGKPYDSVVVATLYAFVRRFPMARFTTDSTQDELREGFDLFRRALGSPLDADMDRLFAHPIVNRKAMGGNDDRPSSN